MTRRTETIHFVSIITDTKNWNSLCFGTVSIGKVLALLLLMNPKASSLAIKYPNTKNMLDDARAYNDYASAAVEISDAHVSDQGILTSTLSLVESFPFSFDGSIIANTSLLNYLSQWCDQCVTLTKTSGDDTFTTLSSRKVMPTDSLLSPLP